MDSPKREDRADITGDLLNEVHIEDATGQKEKVAENIESFLERNEKTDLVIDKVVDIVDGGKKLVGKFEDISERVEKSTEQRNDGAEAMIEEVIVPIEEEEDVAERIKKIVEHLLTDVKMSELSNTREDPGKFENQACSELGEPDTNLVDDEEKKKKRILEMCTKVQETLNLFAEAEKTLELLEESENVVSKLHESFKTLHQKISTQNNLEKESQEIEMALNISSNEFEQFRVDVSVPDQFEFTPAHDSLLSSDQKTTQPLSDPIDIESSSDSQPIHLSPKD